MKFIHDLFEKQRHLFEKGGKLEWAYPLFEAKETFLFVLSKRTAKGAHIRDHIDSKRLMSTVIVALIPCLLFGIYNAGYQYYMQLGGQAAVTEAGFAALMLKGSLHVLPIVIVSYAAGGVWEVLFAVVRKHEINEGFLVTGMLLPLTLPPSTPLWIVALGISFGVVIGKEVFGGTGMNVFNPALTARAFIFFAYPAHISGDKVWRIAPEAGQQLVEGYSGATPLAHAASYNAVELGTPVPHLVNSMSNFGTTAEGLQFADFSLPNAFLGLIPGSIGETSTLMCLIGAAVLLATGVGSWRIMLSSVIGAYVTVSLMNLYAANVLAHNPGSFMSLPPLYQLCLGGFAFGVVFMATDPVSAANTNPGKWVYGFFIGVAAMIIRVINPAYPEGVMLAILFMNAFAPTIDYFVVQRNISRRLSRAQAV